MGMFNKVKELGGQTAVYGLGDAMHKGLGFILIPIYLKFLDPAQFGIVETLLVTMTLMVTLSNMGLPDAVFRFYYKVDNENERSRIISTIFFLSLVGQIGIPLIFFWKSEMLSKLLFKSSELELLLSLAALNIFFSAFKQIPLAIYRAQKRALAFVAVKCATTSVMLLANVYFVAILEKQVLGIMFGFLCGSFTGLIMVLPTLIREVNFIFERKFVKRILAFAVPLGLSHLPLTIILMADRFILAHLTSMAQLGIYTLAHKLANLIKEFIVMPFRLAWGPFTFSNEGVKDARKIYSKMTTYFLMVATTTIVIVSVFSFELVNLLTSKREYLQASKIVPVLSYAFLFFGLSFFASTGIRLSGKTYYFTIIMLVATCINLPLNYILVSGSGYFGASCALVATFFVVTVLSYFVSNKLYPIEFELGRIGVILLTSVFTIYCAIKIQLSDDVYQALLRISAILSYIISINYIGFSKEERNRIKNRIGRAVSIWTSD